MVVCQAAAYYEAREPKEGKSKVSTTTRRDTKRGGEETNFFRTGKIRKPHAMKGEKDTYTNM